VSKQPSSFRAQALSWCIGVCYALAAVPAHAESCVGREFPTTDLLEKGWMLSQPLKVEEVERANLVPGNKRGDLLPFGTMNNQWLELKATITHADTLHKATSSERGEMYVVLRGNCVARAIRTVIVN
jgi:hypothetical protein